MNVEGLPPELLVEIFSRLEFDDIVSAGKVCRRWEEATNDPSVWRSAVVSCDGTAELLERSEMIRNLEIKGVESGSKIRALIQECPGLRSVALIMCRVDVSTMNGLNRLSALTSLSLKNCYRALGSNSDRDWDLDFASLRSLKSLQLSDFGLADRNFEGLLSCRSLAFADIKKIKLSQGNVSSFISQNGKILKLLHLHGGDDYDDECAKAIAKCENIRSLQILRCNRLTDVSLSALKRMRLNVLVLWNNLLFSENGLVDVFSDQTFSERLKYVSFSKVENLTQKVIHIMAEKCTNLEFLGVYRCPKLLAGNLVENNLKELFDNTEVFYA